MWLEVSVPLIYSLCNTVNHIVTFYLLKPASLLPSNSFAGGSVKYCLWLQTHIKESSHYTSPWAMRMFRQLVNFISTMNFSHLCYKTYLYVNRILLKVWRTPKVLELEIVILISKLLVYASMLDSLQPYGLYPMRLLCPWDFPGKNIRLGCYFLLQRIFLTQRWNHVSCITGRFFMTESLGK